MEDPSLSFQQHISLLQLSLWGALHQNTKHLPTQVSTRPLIKKKIYDSILLPISVYSHLQQELNYRYLQDQSGPSSVRHGNRGTAAFSAPNSQANSNNSVLCTAMDIASSSSCGLSTLSEGHRPQIKWCSAHVAIAKQILAHQQQVQYVCI